MNGMMNPNTKASSVGRTKIGQYLRMALSTRFSPLIKIDTVRAELALCAGPARAVPSKRGRRTYPAAPESVLLSDSGCVYQPLARAYSVAQPSTKALTTPAQLSSVWSAA